MKGLIAILILLFGLLQYKLWFAEGRVQELWALEKKVEQLKADNLTLKKRNEALIAEVKNLKEGLDVIEEKARQELGYIGENETFIQYIEPKEHVAD